MVPSGPKNFVRRAKIRETWAKLIGPGTRLPNFNYVFLVGSNNVNLNVEFVLKEEDHSDMLVLDFEDTYLNMTTKVLSGYAWVLDNCPSVKVIGKIDDDVYLNVQRLENYFQLMNI